MPTLGSAKKRRSVTSICTSDAAYLIARLGAGDLAGVLTLEEFDNYYDDRPLCYMDPQSGLMVALGVIELERPVVYSSASDAVRLLGDKLGPMQRTDFGAVSEPGYFHFLKLREYYGQPTAAMPPITPALTADVPVTKGKKPAAKAEGAAKAVWSTAEINKLPDASFMYIEPGGEKDAEGKTKPRSLRHFPIKDANGKLDLPHLRNAIGRIPQSNAPGFTPEKKTQLQNKARKLLDKAQKAAFTDKDKVAKSALDFPVPLAVLQEPELALLLNRISERHASGIVNVDEGPGHLHEIGSAVLAEVKKRGYAPDDSDPFIQWLNEPRSQNLDSSDSVTVPSESNEPEDSLPAFVGRIRKVAPGVDPEWLYVFSVVLEPNDGQDGTPVDPDFDNEIYDKAAIRKASLRWVQKRAFGLLHASEVDGSDVQFADSIVVPEEIKMSDSDGNEIRTGSWLVGSLVRRASETGQKIISGELNAYSIDGLALKSPEMVQVAA